MRSCFKSKPRNSALDSGAGAERGASVIAGPFDISVSGCYFPNILNLKLFRLEVALSQLRRAYRPLFLCFYLASTIAIAQARTSVLVEEVKRDASASAARGHQITGDDKQLSDGFPHYREAKKQGFILKFRPTPIAGFDPPAAQRRIIAAPDRGTSDLVFSLTLSRSPPVLS